MREGGDKIVARSLVRRKWAHFSNPDKWEIAITDEGRKVGAYGEQAPTQEG